MPASHTDTHNPIKRRIFWTTGYFKWSFSREYSNYCAKIFSRLLLHFDGGWCRWALVSLDGVVPSWMVGVSASVNLPLHHKVQKFSSGTGSPGWSWKKGHKTVVVVVLLHFGLSCGLYVSIHRLNQTVVSQLKILAQSFECSLEKLYLKISCGPKNLPFNY